MSNRSQHASTEQHNRCFFPFFFFFGCGVEFMESERITKPLIEAYSVCRLLFTFCTFP